jgi:sigma-E factor negative regulatory protein RseB
MLDHVHTSKAAVCVAFCGFFAAEYVVAGDPETPQDWIDRMGNAVQVTSYEGTVVRVRDGKVDTYKVAHTVKDGVIREKVVIQDGNGLEIIRNGNEVHCILPDRESVLVEEWNNQSTLFATLPSSDIRFGSEYDVLIKNFERVAGRRSAKLAILPHDNYRYGYRIWLDTETGFPLQTQLIGDDNDPIEHVKFADISIQQDILSSALAPSYRTDNWKWYTEPRQAVRREVESDWVADEVPPGFRVVSTQQKILPDAEDPLTHIIYGDGLVTVSVFIAPVTDKKKAGHSRFGASNSYSTVIDEYRVTAVGQVPEITVEQIAKSMRQNR